MEKDRSLLVVNALGLVRHCPSGKPHLSCPFYKISNCFSLRDSYKYLTALTDEDIFQMIRQHNICSLSRSDESSLKISIYN
jgi:hypothetical protein